MEVNRKPFERKFLFLTYPNWNNVFLDSIKIDSHNQDPKIVHRHILSELNDAVDEFNVTLEHYIIAQERHADGRPHFHVYMQLSKPLKTRDMTIFDIDGNHPNVQICNNTEFVQRYCKKDGNYLSDIGDNELVKFGLKKTSRQMICSELLSGRTLDSLVEEHPQVLFDYKKYQESVNLYKLASQPRSDTQHIKGIWIYGKSGVGKSTGARKLVQDAGLTFFLKPQNKWWDGYQGQPIVILDDLDSDTLSHYLKIWLDHFSCTGEIKGGNVPLLFKHFIITSNHSIEDLFRNNDACIEPIKRRCQIFEMLQQGPIPVRFNNIDVVNP